MMKVLNRMSRLTTLMQVLVLLSVAVMSSATRAQDATVETLEQFIQSLDAFEATFEQTLYSEGGEALKSSTGSIQLKRPARFIWTYDDPEPQQIVADGTRVWLYDQDLEQVTVNDIDDRINGTPLQFLINSEPLSQGFAIESLGESDDIDWFALQPLTEASDFEQVFIGLQGDALAVMELRDSFGQATQIVLDNFVKDVTLDDDLFVFEVPEGVDVIGLDE